MQSAQVESTHGEAVSPERAPEAISKVVASLPPEQMFELMKQMKLVIQVLLLLREYNFNNIHIQPTIVDFLSL